MTRKVTATPITAPNPKFKAKFVASVRLEVRELLVLEAALVVVACGIPSDEISC